MKIEVDDKKILALKKIHNCLFLFGSHLYVIKEYKIVEEKRLVKHWFSEPTEVIDKYVTDMVVMGYSVEDRFLTQLTEDGCTYLLQFCNLYEMRRRWMDMHEQIKAFGFEINKVKEV
jgi:hypothetical protein